MLAKGIFVTALCLMAAACSGMPGSAANDGSSGSRPTSYESGYGIGSGSSGENTDGHMSWGE